MMVSTNIIHLWTSWIIYCAIYTQHGFSSQVIECFQLHAAWACVWLMLSKFFPSALHLQNWVYRGYDVKRINLKWGPRENFFRGFSEFSPVQAVIMVMCYTPPMLPSSLSRQTISVAFSHGISRWKSNQTHPLLHPYLYFPAVGDRPRKRCRELPTDYI